ncbi:MAG: PspC domain-containing protein [Atopococcus tabaci]|uniref:PspC domain-containing protein n=1 Tax=Atopococcus tabaci TaxID=269774 RepID=A0AA43ZRQ4_9LACT|nr:PspC domain-containing protein [Atopococcus tabaci]
MKIKRSRSNRILLGVCGGLADKFNMSAWTLRLLFIIFSFLGMGVPALIYLILAMIMPEDETKSIQEMFSEKIKGYEKSRKKQKREIKEAEKVFKDN